MTPIIYMESTLNLMLHNGMDKQVSHIVKAGTHRVTESKAGKFIIIKHYHNEQK